MPRVKIERLNSTDSSKDVTTRSKAKTKSKELSTPPVLKKRKLIVISNTKSVASKGRPKKQSIEKNTNNGNSRQNKTSNDSNENSITKDDIDENNKKVEQKPNQNKRIIILDDSSRDSNDDNEYNSEDDYSPDTEDEEEYRSRSHFW